MTKIFPNTGAEFSGYDAATAWLVNNGYSHGSIQREAPVGILKGDYEIAKWRNLTVKERRELDGEMTAGWQGMRHGDVTVTIKD